MSRTLKEINWRISEIRERRNIEAKFEMSIHGVSPSGEKSEKDTGPRKLKPEEEKAMEIALEQAKIRKARQYGRSISN